jgi:uncharacterized membrane protein
MRHRHLANCNGTPTEHRGFVTWAQCDCRARVGWSIIGARNLQPRAPMKFIKSTLFTGFLILLPVLLLWLALGEIFQLLVALIGPIVPLLPEGLLSGTHLPGILAAIVLVVAAAIVGLIARSTIATLFGAAFERSVLAKLPMYPMLKSLSESFLDVSSSNFRPALVMAADGSATPCYLVEDSADGSATVMLPWSPTSFAGSVRIVPRHSLRLLHCSLMEFSRALSLMGVGVSSCVEQGPQARQPTD